MTRLLLIGAVVLMGAAPASHCNQRALNGIPSPGQTDADIAARACLCSDDQVDITDVLPLQHLNEKLRFAQICLADARSQLAPQSWAIQMCGCVTDKVSAWVRQHRVVTLPVHPPVDSAQGAAYRQADAECEKLFPRPSRNGT